MEVVMRLRAVKNASACRSSLLPCVLAMSAVFAVDHLGPLTQRAGEPDPIVADARAATMALDDAIGLVRNVVDARVLPGATVAIGRGPRVLSSVAFGHLGWRESDGAVSPDSTMYDLASLTKAVATTTAVLLLVQDRRIRLDEPVQRWIPDFHGRWKEDVTWRHLLTHTSGLPPAGRMRGNTPARRLRSLLRSRLVAPPGQLMMYSDLGFIVAWQAATRAAGQPLPRYLEHRVWRPLGMHHTAVWPGLDCERCAPTLWLRRGEPYRGKPADPIAHRLGIPSGNAGLFSSAHDLARFAAMIANGGELDGVRVLRRDLVAELFRQAPGAGRRTLGWEAWCPSEERPAHEACVRPVAVGHTGWTGTSLFIDPAHGTWVVLLSNRSYLRRTPPSLDTLRRALFASVSRALTRAKAERDLPGVAALSTRGPVSE